MTPGSFDFSSKYAVPASSVAATPTKMRYDTRTKRPSSWRKSAFADLLDGMEPDDAVDLWRRSALDFGF
jgi:hypothetical protein